MSAEPDAENPPYDRSDPLRSIRAMIAEAKQDALREVGLALHARLNAPETAIRRRVAELGFLANSLEEHPQDPNRLPSLNQDVYDETRKRLAPKAPSSEILAKRYGSWKRACYAAYGLRIDGSKCAPGNPWPSNWTGMRMAPNFSREECVASVRACAEAIGRRPTSSTYSEWRINRRARARAAGEKVRLAPVRRILALLAPERGERDGWKIVLAKVFG
jgi:hypothetical protein